MDYFLERIITYFQFPLQEPVLLFSLLLFIILLSPIILRKIRLPAIIGLIISGAIIGPHGLGLIGPNTLADEGSIKLFSTIGLLYIMFIAGLELDLNQFRKQINKSLIFGALTFIIPLGLGYPICSEILHLSPLASLLTASMFATHTLVSYPIVSKYGLSKHSAVAIAVGGTILTDTAVLIIFVVIKSSEKGVLDFGFWGRLITSLSIFLAIMFFIIPRIAKWFFRKLDSEKTSQYIFVLSVLFFSAFLAQVAGFEHIIGAFVAGLVLNRLIPSNSILMNRIDFIGNSLFIPFFLIFVGMVINYKIFFQGTWPLIIAGVLTSFAVFSKWLAALVTQWIFKMSNNERQVIFGLSTSHAAATLAIIMVGYNNGILNINIVNGTVVLILFTCMISSFVTEAAGKKLLIEISDNSDIDDNETKLRNQHVIVAMNELSGNEQLLDFALLISDQKVINPISVVSVYPNDAAAEKMIRKSRKSLEEIIKHVSGHESKLNTIATIDHNLSSGLSRVAKELVADIVVLNDSRNKNLLSRIVGDDRAHLLDVCDRTIFFCQLDNPSISYGKVMLIAPPLSELETTFVLWAERVIRLAKELSIPIDLYASVATLERFEKVGVANKLDFNIHFQVIENIDDFFLYFDKKEKGIIIFCGSRIGSVSYDSGSEYFAGKIEKACPKNDVIFIYPGMELDKMNGNYIDISSTPINAGVATIQKIGREVGNIFKKSSSKKSK